MIRRNQGRPLTLAQNNGLQTSQDESSAQAAHQDTKAGGKLTLVVASAQVARQALSLCCSTSLLMLNIMWCARDAGGLNAVEGLRWRPWQASDPPIFRFQH